MFGHMPEEARMSVKRVSLFRNGANQAVRIPREFELPGNEAVMRKEGGRLVIEPVPRPSLIELFRTWEPLDEEWPEIEDPPPEPVEI
jgi:antitoxin VapB